MGGIKIEQNTEVGPKWVASGKIGETVFLGGSDDLDTLKRWIDEAKAEESRRERETNA